MITLADLSTIEQEARSMWSERQEECAKYGADIPMPCLYLPVDVLCALIRRYVAPMTPQVKVAGQRMIKHVENLKKVAAEMREAASKYPDGHPRVAPDPELMQRAGLAEMQAEDFLSILNAIPEAEPDA